MRTRRRFQLPRLRAEKHLIAVGILYNETDRELYLMLWPGVGLCIIFRRRGYH